MADSVAAVAGCLAAQIAIGVSNTLLGERQASVPVPQQGEPQACQNEQQQELEPAQVLASIQALQLDLDFCRGTNRERLVQLQQQERAVKQKHQDLVFLMQQYQAVMGKDQKDEAVQTEVTSCVAIHRHSDTSYNILKERTELLEQKPWDRVGGGNASLPPLSQAAQALAQQPPAPSMLQHTEEQSCQCLGKGTQHKANCKVEAELQALQKQAASSKAEQAQSRELAVWLQAELSQWQWKQQVTLEQALQHMHAAAHAEEKLQRSQEQLQVLREQLRAQKEQSQGLWHSLTQLREELGATQAREQLSLQQLSRAKETIQNLHQEVASNKKHLTELLQQVQDAATLQAELAQAQQEKAKQEEKIAAYEEQRQQLHWELRKLQWSQEQSTQEVYSLQERLQELSSQAQRWQQLHQESEQALAMREEELVVCKVELAFLKEELSKATEQVEMLHSSHALACSDNSRPRKERELVLVNISQHVKEQMQSNEKLGHKIQQQIKQTTELTGEKEHLQDTLGRRQEENTYLMVRTHEQHHKCEELKALPGNNLTVPALHDSAGLPPPSTCFQDKKQRKTKQGLD
ncbi:polyamine-modulated factor 1-binding protein 1 [Grus japonensis]|uniref:Polyamine-modulated factor 1-binding protein 1 n=1 Tax=Grus japonensis TaxID=30415 RepID=A0ABC9XEB5_GRUJA